MAQYTYLFMDLLTQAINAELPCERVQFSSVLNGAGTFRGYIPLDDPAVQRQNPGTTTETGRTAILVDRDGVLVWGGVLWTRQWDSSTQLLEVGAGDFMTYFAHRYLTITSTYTATDQLAIAAALVNFAQSVLGGNIHVVVPTQPVSGVQRTVGWYGYELQEIAKLIEDLAAMEQGFDFGFDVAYNTAGVPTVTLNLGYPRRGRDMNSTGWMWEYPGNITSYIWPEDGEVVAETAWATGSGSGVDMLLASSTSQTLLNAGWPLTEVVKSYRDVTDQGVLAAHALADVNAYGSAVTLPQLTVRADVDPVLGSYITGDDARVRITDAFFPAPTSGGAGLDTTLRIHQIDVTPPSGDQAPETVKLTMGPTQT